MHTMRTENVDGSREGRRYRRDKDRETPVLKFFNDECRYESVLNLGQCRLP